jgi:hypothetical protein
MSVQLSIEYEQVMGLVEQLSPEEQIDLMVYLVEKAKTRELTIRERRDLLNAMAVDLGAVLSGYSDRREDWYS